MTQFEFTCAVVLLFDERGGIWGDVLHAAVSNHRPDLLASFEQEVDPRGFDAETEQYHNAWAWLDRHWLNDSGGQ